MKSTLDRREFLTRTGLTLAVAATPSGLKIPAWGLQPFMCAGDFSQIVEAACERTGVEQAPLSDRPRLVTDRGPASAFPISFPQGRQCKLMLRIS